MARRVKADIATRPSRLTPADKRDVVAGSSDMHGRNDARTVCIGRAADSLLVTNPRIKIRSF